MFSIIRIIIGCVFLVCSVAIIKKSKVVHKRLLYIVFSSISASLIVVLMFLPFENLFITFDSPKSAYEYVSFGKSNIELVVEGNNCDFVIERNEDADTYLIIPKTTDGWKIGLGLNTKKIAQEFSNGITVYVYRYKKSNDYFITILDANGGRLEITDSYNSKFNSLEKTNNLLGKTFVTYFAHISDFDSQYCVIVNGSKIRPSD